jgi:hypothetical protein
VFNIDMSLMKHTKFGAHRAARRGLQRPQPSHSASPTASSGTAFGTITTSGQPAVRYCSARAANRMALKLQFSRRDVTRQGARPRPLFLSGATVDQVSANGRRQVPAPAGGGGGGPGAIAAAEPPAAAPAPITPLAPHRRQPEAYWRRTSSRGAAVLELPATACARPWVSADRQDRGAPAAPGGGRPHAAGVARGSSGSPRVRRPAAWRGPAPRAGPRHRPPPPIT